VTRRAEGIDAVREPVAGPCPECGGETLARYEVLAEGGWFEVVKCQGCLHSVERRRISPLVRMGRERYI
jgi:hypothetical protein